VKAEAKIIEWDGENLPVELRDLPPGQYVVQPVDEALNLSAEEEDGIIAALDDLDAEGGTPLEDVLREIRSHSAGR
jgi:hypothetical protein